jgi:hypothetical protein
MTPRSLYTDIFVPGIRLAAGAVLVLYGLRELFRVIDGYYCCNIGFYGAVGAAALLLGCLFVVLSAQGLLRGPT